ncbi:hypothetical protein C8F04DRAFT_523425 [Mycena alexandri]|uniref:Uncharacterized protein n=1 Tax=Mycena alexandri TaxID=1745969 RepID=A0AAD6TF57_9AGAR|nr:hypothetical protein C8F04DRAFT_523425 [Mycena alexandri]
MRNCLIYSFPRVLQKIQRKLLFNLSFFLAVYRASTTVCQRNDDDGLRITALSSDSAIKSITFWLFRAAGGGCN